MKRNIIRYISLILVLAMSLSISAAAANMEEHIEVTLSEDALSFSASYDEVQVARDTYVNLSPEARQLFNQLLANDPELGAFHKANVDNSFQVNTIGTYAAAPSSSALTALSNQLAALGLPAAVKYALEAMAAGMASAIADGPLPIGDILLAAATASAAVVIAANWSSVSSKWNSIVSAFTTAFSTMVSNVMSAFSEIKSEVPNIQSATIITATDRTIVVQGVTYNCGTKVQSLTKQQINNNKYYVGVLALNDVWVDISKPVTPSLARLIIAANNPIVGVVAISQSYARGVAGAYPIGPERHGTAANYYYHYHNALHRKAHIWYPHTSLA